MVASVNALLQAQDQFALAGNKLNSSAHRVFALAEIGNNSDTMLAVRDIEVALDIMRATVWRFQVTLDPKDMSSFKANVQNLNATVETFGQVANAQAKAPLGDLTTAVKSYDDAFSAVAKTMIANEDIYSNQIRPLLADIYKTTNGAKGSIIESQQLSKKAADDCGVDRHDADRDHGGRHDRARHRARLVHRPRHFPPAAQDRGSA